MKLSSEAARGKVDGLIAIETMGRVRSHAENNDEATLKRFADDHVAAEAAITTDGLASSIRAASATGRTT